MGHQHHSACLSTDALYVYHTHEGHPGAATHVVTKRCSSRHYTGGLSGYVHMPCAQQHSPSMSQLALPGLQGPGPTTSIAHLNTSHSHPPGSMQQPLLLLRWGGAQAAQEASPTVSSVACSATACSATRFCLPQLRLPPPSKWSLLLLLLLLLPLLWCLSCTLGRLHRSLSALPAMELLGSKL
jgi:hypothetical protein